MTYPGVSVGAHQCPLCLSFGRHEYGCPELAEELPEPDKNRTCRVCGDYLLPEEVNYCFDHSCGGSD